MREIKFRAWLPDVKKIGMVTNLDGTNDGYKFFRATVEYFDDRNFQQFYTTNLFELMQFTGLLDKNGREIYEGDVIRFQKFANWDDEGMSRHWGAVIFKEGCFMWNLVKEGHQGGYYNAHQTEPLRNTNSTWGLEVIGNIYENSELLPK